MAMHLFMQFDNGSMSTLINLEEISEHTSLSYLNTQLMTSAFDEFQPINPDKH